MPSLVDDTGTLANVIDGGRPEVDRLAREEASAGVGWGCCSRVPPGGQPHRNDSQATPSAEDGGQGVDRACEVGHGGAVSAP
jgi:hypothetical protein